MRQQKSIKNNMVMNIILTASNFIFPLITYSYVARVLGTDGTGKVAFVNSIIQYFSYIAVLGIPAYGLRECAKVRDDKARLSHTVQELLMINLISTGIAYAALAVSVFAVPKLFAYKELFLVMAISILLNTIGLEWLYRALEEYSYITVRSLIFKVIAVVLTFILIRSSEHYIWYGFLTIFTASASCICNFINIRKYVNLRKIGSYDFKRHLRPIFTLMGASIALAIYANFDVSMIGFIRSEHEVGLYNAALKIKGIILSISTATTSVLIPRMSYYVQQKDPLGIRKLVMSSFRISLVLALPVVVYVFIFPEQVLRFVCGTEFLDAAGTLRILMLCVLPLMITNLFGNQLLIPMGFEKRYSQSIFVGMWINLVLNLVMIPILGSCGAAIGTLITECWNVFWMSGGVKKYRAMLIKKINYLQYLLPLGAGALLSWLISLCSKNFNIFLQFTFSAAVFFGVYYGMLLLLKEPLFSGQLSLYIQKIRKLCKK